MIKVRKMQKLKRHTGMLMMAAVLVFRLTACKGKEVGNMENLYMGTITTIDDNTITVTVMGEGQFPTGMPGGGMPGGEMPEGFNPGEFPEGEMPEGKNPPSTPNGDYAKGEYPDGELPEGFEAGKMPEGFKPDEMLKGETMTLKISKDTNIKINEESGKLEDLKVGDLIQFTEDGKSITVINMGFPQQGVPKQGKQ